MCVYVCVCIYIYICTHLHIFLESINFQGFQRPPKAQAWPLVLPIPVQGSPPPQTLQGARTKLPSIVRLEVIFKLS